MEIEMMDTCNDVTMSIIVPTYNVERYVAEALESVLRQDYGEFEVICIDNASTDGTRKILEKYAALDQRIRLLFNEKNEGISYSRNRGIEAANGAYIVFLDADDRLAEHALERMHKHVMEDKVDILFFDAIAEYENEELRKTFGHYKPNRKGKEFPEKTGKALFTSFVKENLYTDVLWRQCFKKDFLMRKNLCFTPGKLHEDVVFSFKAILSAKNVSCVQEEYYIYYRREGSLTSREDELEAFRCVFSNYCNMLRYWQNNEFDISTQEAIMEYLNKYYSFINRKFYYARGIGHLQIDDPFENHEYQVFKINRKRLGEYGEKLHAAKKIIIYGAGNVAERVLREFYSDKIIGIAVSRMAQNPTEKFGLPVHELKEYREYATDALVIICTMPELQEDMIKQLKEEGFTDYICVI